MSVVMFNHLYPPEDQRYRGNFADLTNSFSIHFFAEGFVDEKSFDKAVVNVWRQLLEIAPFNLIKSQGVFLSCYQYWLPSPVNTTDLGPVLVANEDARPTNRTNYNVYMWPNSGGSGPDYFIDFDRNKFLTSIEDTEVPISVP